jgi:hypothetical protein
MSYTYYQSVYRERTNLPTSRGYDHLEPSRGVPSAPTSTKKDKSKRRKHNYSQKDFHRVVDGKITDTIEVFTQVRTRKSSHKTTEAPIAQTYSHCSAKPTEPDFTYDHSSTFSPTDTKRYRPVKDDQTAPRSEDGCTYYGSEDGCSLVPDIWEAGSTTSPVYQRPMRALDPPFKRLLLEAPPSSELAQSVSRHRGAESVISGDTRVSRGRQPHRERRR